MWLSTKFCWGTFLSSLIQKEEKNFYLFWCSFTCKSTDYIQCTVSLLTYLFCMWLSTKFCWWTFLSSSIQKEEKNLYLFWCWFPYYWLHTVHYQSLNIFILHVTFNKLSLMSIFIFIDPKRRKEFLPILMLIYLKVYWLHTVHCQSLNIFILHVTFNKNLLMNICIFISSKRRKEFLLVSMLISL